MLALSMTQKEAALLDAFLLRATRYLEFGSGGSTCRAAQRVRDQIITVDSSEQWLSSVKSEVEALAKHPNLLAHYCDIGAVREWGYPANQDRRDYWPEYSLGVWSVEGAVLSDLYLIDGRFRVSCFAETMLRAEIGSFVMIHDFSDRPHYHVVNDFARCIAESERLSVFVKDEKTDLTTARRIADEFRFEPA